MEEQLITFETAVLAKEKGFVNGTKGCFIVYKEDNINPKGDKGTKKGEFEYCKRFSLKNGELDSDEDYNYLERPTQSLLQKWLREVHKISVESTSCWWDDGKKEFEYNVYKKDLGGDSPCSLSVFKTYEEALELGLQEALKLI
jgi:hypothetical protein